MKDLDLADSVVLLLLLLVAAVVVVVAVVVAAIEKLLKLLINLYKILLFIFIL